MNTYNIGPLTMEYVFKRAGLGNVSDMQAVFDAVEAGIEKAKFEALTAGIEWARGDE